MEFRSFMEVLEDDPLYRSQLLYGDSFLYMAPVDSNMYNLRIVAAKSIATTSYFTLSQKGITHFGGDGSSDFTPLHQFEREYYLYHMISQIPFFAKYRLWKMFSEWKKGVNNKKNAARSAALDENLFILQPTLRRSLIALRRLSYTVSNYKLYNVDAKKTYTLDEFCNQQRQQKASITRRLEKFNDRVRGLVHTACESALREFLENQGFHSSEGDGENGEAGGGGGGGGAGAAAASRVGTGVGGARVASAGPGGAGGTAAAVSDALGAAALPAGGSSWGMAQSSVHGAPPQGGVEDMSREITFTERAAMRTQCRRLAKYIRVADFFVVDTFLTLVLGSTQNLLESIRSHDLAELREKAKAQLAAAKAKMKGKGGASRAQSRASGELADKPAADGGANGDAKKSGKQSPRPGANGTSPKPDGDAAAAGAGTGTGGAAGAAGKAGVAESKGAEAESTAKEADEGPPPLFSVEVDVDLDDEGDDDQFPMPGGGDDGDNGEGKGSDGLADDGGAGAARSGSQARTRTAGSGVSRARKVQSPRSLRSPRDGEEEDLLDDNASTTSGASAALPDLVGLNFNPKPEDFRHQLEMVVFDGLKVVTTPERMLTHPMFRLYVQPSVDENGQLGEGMDLEVMIVEDGGFQAMVDDINAYLRKAFGYALRYARVFTPYRDVVLENFRTLGDMTFDNYVDMQLHEFSFAAKAFAQQSKVFAEMSTSRDVGVIRVDSTKLKSEFEPSPLSCVNRLRELLPQIARHKCDTLLAEVQDTHEKLATRPYNVDDFVVLMSALRTSNDELPTLERRYEFVNEMFMLLGDEDMEVTEEAHTNFFMLGQIMTQLKTAMQLAEDSAEDNTARFSKELDDNVPKLRGAIANCRARLDHAMVHSPESDMDQVLKYLNKLQVEVADLDKQAKRFTRYQDILRIPTTSYEDLDDVKADLSLKTRLWSSLRSWGELTAEWQATDFADVDADSIGAKVLVYSKTALQAERGLPGSTVAPKLKAMVDEFQGTLPVVVDLRNQFLKERHWTRIHDLVGFHINGVEGMTLGALIDMHVQDHADVINTIASEAVQENVLEQMLDKVATVWNETEFELHNYKDTKDVFILGSVEEIIAALDDSLVTINTVLGSRYVVAIRAEVDDYQKRLLLFQETLDEWLNCQRNWMYLETIFSAPDIQRQLPLESKSFNSVDLFWKETMKKTYEDGNALKCATRPGLREHFQKHNAALDKIQKSLEDYLETKRQAFPRFYFLSNDELLEILAQTKDPKAVQPHLRKCFDNIYALRFGDVSSSSVDITAMVSAEGEVVDLGRNLKARGNVEDWLTSVEEHMRTSLHRVMKAGLQDYESRPRTAWVLAHHGQVVATVAQMMWSRGTEAALRGDDMGRAEAAAEVAAANLAQLQAAARDAEEQAMALAMRAEEAGDDDVDGEIGYAAEAAAERSAEAAAALEDAAAITVPEYGSPVEAAMASWLQVNVADLSELTALVRGPLNKLQRKVIVALVTTDVHARDIVETLHGDRVDSLHSFEWQKQLRYYWEEDACLARQSNTKIAYGWEYEGCTSRLVITPLTDRCWMTLTGSLHLKLGGNPAGPAGTGKTESSKDLAKALGVQCIVFNCSEQIDYKMMGKLFAGLSQAGAWTCLDEFNRIDIEVLSVIAQQLLVLRQGRLAGDTHITFEGREIRLREHHVIVTMNPGYAGRTELPDNLKVFFRPVAMMVPDYTLIAEIMLFAEGFDDAKTLSRKMTKLYKLSSEQLSQQCHYDYGLRAVKSVLVMAGGLKRANPSTSEDVVLIRAMRDSNLPKFLSDDLPLFHGIVQDLFPGVEVPYEDTGELEATVIAELEKAGHQPVEASIHKIIQLYETMNVRFGAVLVGPTGGGKTTAYRMLAAALTSLKKRGVKHEAFQRVFTNVLNPKCISMGELYGAYNELTQEWTDGLASTLMRSAAAQVDDTRRWTVFDGPIDALWIENMNTVLDDNMMLCLANGERIKLRPAMRMLFEVMDLEEASPATVSRLGVVYVSEDTVGWAPYVKSWMQSTMGGRLSEKVATHLWEAFEALLPSGLGFLRDQLTEPVPTVDMNVAASLCAIFQAVYDDNNGVIYGADDMAAIKLADKALAFAYIWSVGGAVTPDLWPNFDKFAREGFDSAKLEAGVPSGGFVYDFMVRVSHGEGAFRPWSEAVPKFHYTADMRYFEMMVPTTDTVRYSAITEMLLGLMKPVFLTGVTGTGKTAILQNLLSRLATPPETDDDSGAPADDGADTSGNTLPVFLNFSAQTSSKVTQATIESKLEKKRNTLLGAPVGKRIVIMVDDVNMPAVEEYGAQPPIELLRQFLDFKGFYDRAKRFWKNVDDTCLIACAAPPGGGRNALTPRFTRHFNVLCMPPASATALERIFSSILGGFLEGFLPDVKQLCNGVVNASIDVYQRISAELLPTPAKSHYTFNLRDVSKVFQGVLMIHPHKCQRGEVLTKLWIHESLRVFHDRLINVEDKTYFTQLIVELLHRHFRGKWDHATLFEGDPIVFGDYLRPGAEERLYEEVTQFSKLASLLEDYLEGFNLSQSNTMDLVFFQDAIEHVSRICRILSQPRGNALLVGVGGSGRQSLTRLAAHMCEYECSGIELTRGYGIPEFRDDLKGFFMKAGVQGKPTVFLFTDTQILDEGFVEDINNVLNAGEVPNLLEQDDMDNIVSSMRPVVKEMGLAETRDECYTQFVARVRDNLHLVLALSPVGDSFRVRCRMFPSLINCCTIDWFTAWPRSALESVAERFLADLELPSDEVREGLVKCCAEVHLSLDALAGRFWDELRRRVYTTPKSYLDLISLYLELLAEKRAELGGARDRLLTGVTKLEDTNAMVATLKQELTELQPVLAQKTVETDALIKEVSANQAAASKVREKVASEEAVVKAQASEVSVVQADAQKDLDVAMPALANAIKALDALDKKDITEMKSFAKPPAAVQVVMEAVCTLLKEKTDWDAAKRVLGQGDFLIQLRDYDKDHISTGLLKKLKKYVEDPVMEVDNMRKVSTAATSLCMWVHAMDVYARVFKEVAPKRERLEEMNQKLSAANADLAEKQAALNEVESTVAALQAKCDETVAEKNRLQHEAELTKARLVRAEKLTQGLADEGVRWAESAAGLGEGVLKLVGDTFTGVACVSYFGAFSGRFRDELVEQWEAMVKAAKIPCSAEFSLQASLGDVVKVREWQIQGLPTDAVSTDNALLVKRAKRWPLMIDPQGQANKWVKNLEAAAHMEITKINNPNLLRSLDQSVRVGRPMLIEDIGEVLDPVLDSVLNKQTFRIAGRLLIHIGDQDVDYDENFRLYLTTKMPNPHYLPEVCIRVTVINFTVTTEGLEDQLLGAVVRKERPDIEKKKNRLLVSLAADTKQLKDVEDKILDMLSDASGNILDDEELINALSNSKTMSGIIKERVAETRATQVEIAKMREEYRAVAVRGSIIYFVIADLAMIDPMYQYSLEYFARLFNTCIDDAPKSADLPTRLETLVEYQTNVVYEQVCRGLFEQHKMLFSFVICAQIMRARGEITNDEWFLLLRGAGVVPRAGQPDNPQGKRISEVQWDCICSMSQKIPAYAGLSEHMSMTWPIWESWADATDAHMRPLPSGFEKKVTEFQKLVYVRAMREDCVVPAVRNFVRNNLGEGFISPPTASMEDIHKSMDPKTPCIFVLSQGADPTGILLRFAEEREYAERLHVISLGQGQGPKAEALIKEASESGDWVLLQNCHLAKSWMPRLEAVVLDNIDNEAALHEDFRLFLTSFPAAYFPVPVLQNGVKLTNEPPRGLRANLLRSYQMLVSDETFDACTKTVPWRKLLFGLCFFHGIIQERRKFGPLGWNIRYEFNDTDLETSISVLHMFLEEQSEIPWDALRYVLGEINYGGRVTDDWDRRCLLSILSRFCTPGMLEDGYNLSGSGLYKVPSAEDDLEGVKAFIGRLPQQAEPEVFGMHANADITFQVQESTNLLSTVLSIQPRQVGSAPKPRSASSATEDDESGEEGDAPVPQTNDDLVLHVADEIVEHLPYGLLRSDAGRHTFPRNRETGLLDSLATVLLQEMEKFNKLLARMSSSLRDLKRAIKGLVVMSQDLDLMYQALLDNRVPHLWAAVAYPSLRPLASWVKDLHVRMAFMRGWLHNGRPVVFPLPAFFFPQGFMTGALQNHARKYKVPVNTLDFAFSVYAVDADLIVSAPKDGVIVDGLWLEGASWDRKDTMIRDSVPGEMYSRMPPVHFLPTENYLQPEGTYKCPVYKTSVRAGALSTTGTSTNFVVAVDVPTDKTEDQWVWSGVAFLLNLND